MARPSTMDDSAALAALGKAADDLFYRHGVVAVSMAQLRDASGVSLRRLYALCPSKADLISLWLHHRHEVWMSGFSRAVDERIATGQPVIDSIFSAVAAWMTETDFRGCGFINTNAETSELTVEHRKIIQDHKRSVAEYLSTITSNGPAIGVLVDGAMVQASIFSNTKSIDLAKQAAIALVEQKQT